MTDINNIVEQGIKLATAGKHKEAHAKFIEACEAAPESVVAWCNRGGSAFLSGDQQDAGGSYEKALSLDAKNIEATIGLARISLLANEWDRAINLLASDQTTPDGYYIRGIAYEQKGDIAKAIDSYLIAIESSHEQALKALHRLYVFQDMPHELAKLVSSPESPDYHLITALIQALPSPQSRWIFLNECVSRYPKNPTLYDIASGVFLHKKEFAYASRTCVIAKRNIPEINITEWPSLKECAWF